MFLTRRRLACDTGVMIVGVGKISWVLHVFVYSAASTCIELHRVAAPSKGIRVARA